MNVIGIIAEYNPFHAGHHIHISMTRELVGKDCPVIAVMSGGFVQRGDFAIFNKWARAEAAVMTLGGADLVLEIQTPFANATAEKFALNGVRMLEACGMVTHLSFGSEAGEVEPLEKIADYLLSDAFNDHIGEYMTGGTTFAAARQKLADKDLGNIAEHMKTPNNTLGIEYIKAIKKEMSRMQPVTVRREGSEHDSEYHEHGIASASKIRSMILGGQAYSAMKFLPEQSIEIAIREISRGTGPISLAMNSFAIMACLRKLKPEDFEKLPDVGEGLHMRIYNMLKNAGNINEAADIIKTKRYSHARIRRILMSAYLSITGEAAAMRPQYLRVLAFNDTGRTLLRDMKETSRLPIITKPADMQQLDEDGKKLFEIEAVCTDLYSICCPSERYRMAGNDYRYSPKYLR